MKEVPFLPIEFYPSLLSENLARNTQEVDHPVIAAFVGRIPNVDVKTDREIALNRLKKYHTEVRYNLGLSEMSYVTAVQLHTANVGVVTEDIAKQSCFKFENTDSLITNLRNVCLGIFVADCCIVYLYDPIQKAIGLVHAGKKGAQAQIVTNTIVKMQKHYHTDPKNVIVQLSPCIRPPHYEVDIVSEITTQCKKSGLEARNIHDCLKNTAADLERYYSYRMEKGKTGRMLGLLALRA